jgi:hypothetical protein
MVVRMVFGEYLHTLTAPQKPRAARETIRQRSLSIGCCFHAGFFLKIKPHSVNFFLSVGNAMEKN